MERLWRIKLMSEVTFGLRESPEQNFGPTVSCYERLEGRLGC